MKLLYVYSGRQLGVPEVTRAFGKRGIVVELYNPMDGLLFRRGFGSIPVPNVNVMTALTLWFAWRNFGWAWREYYLHTCYVFDAVTRQVASKCRRTKPGCILQTGALFGSGDYPTVPYYLYIDSTRAIAERYEPFPGLPLPIPFDAALRARERIVYRKAKGIFSMSAYTRNSLVNEYGIDPTHVHVVGAGPNVVAESSANVGLREKAFLFVGLKFLRKGGPTVIEAFARVRERHPDAKLWIVGGHRRNPPEPGVSYLGRLDPEQLTKWYARAMAFVLPTLRDPFPLAILEAMEFGLPCIATQIEGVPEVVADGETGMLVPPGNISALVEAMLRLLDDPAHALRMGRKKKWLVVFG